MNVHTKVPFQWYDEYLLIWFEFFHMKEWTYVSKETCTGVRRIYCDVCVGQLMILFYFLEIWYTFGTHVNVSVSAGH